MIVSAEYMQTLAGINIPYLRRQYPICAKLWELSAERARAGVQVFG